MESDTRQVHVYSVFLNFFFFCSFEPCLPIQSLEIGNVEVKGAPDIIYAHHRINQSEKKVEKPCIVAICEVKVFSLFFFT